MEFRVDLTYDELVAKDEVNKKLHLVSLASHGSPLDPLYAAIWLDLPGEPRPRSITRDPLTLSPGRPVEVEVEGAAASPILMTGTGDTRTGGHLGARLTWVYELYPKSKFTTTEKPRVDVLVRPNLSELGSNTQTCISFDAVWFTTLNERREPFKDVRYLGILAPNPTSVFGFYRAPVSDSVGGLRRSPRYLAAHQGFKRCHTAVPAPKNSADGRTVVVHMRGDTYAPWPDDMTAPFNGGTITDGPMNLQKTSEVWAARHDKEGLIPIQVGANGIGKDTRLCITWAPRWKPKPRYFRVTSGAAPYLGARVTAPRKSTNTPVLNEPPPTVPAEYSLQTKASLNGLLSTLETTMRTSNIANAQVAIAVDGKLKLAWNLTFGEVNWPLTQPKNRFRLASCSKFLTGIRAVDLGDSFLESTALEALGIGANDLGGDDDDQKDWLAAVTIQDLLRMVPGLAGDSTFFKLCWLYGGKSLPLRMGKFSAALQNGAPIDFMKAPAGADENYEGFPFTVVAEATAQTLLGDPKRFIEAAQGFWDFDQMQMPIVVPEDNVRCFLAGEAPARSYVCVGRNTSLSGSFLDLVEEEHPLPPWVPGGYHENADMDLWSAGGGLTASAPSVARVLQMLHPVEAGPFPAWTRLPLERLMRLGTRQLTPLANEALPTWSLGCRYDFSESTSTQRQRHEFSKGGSLSSGQAATNHFVFTYPSAPPRSMSVVVLCTGTNPLSATSSGTVRKTALDIFDNGGWDGDYDLFPAFTLT